MLTQGGGGEGPPPLLTGISNKAVQKNHATKEGLSKGGAGAVGSHANAKQLLWHHT